ncbi:MAG: hypothetical protein P8016_16885 [Sedimentisphaerales bacterium]
MKIKRRPPFPWSLLGFWTLRILPIWLLTGFMIFLVQFVIGGILHDNTNIQAMINFLDLMPSFIRSAIGGDMLKQGRLPGLIAMGYQHPLVLFLYMLFAVGVPTGLLAGEVQKGTMELVLSRYVSKTHVYICAGFITVTGMFALVLVMFSGTIVAMDVFKFQQQISLYPFFKIAINGGILASAVGGIALMTAAWFERNTAVWISAAFLVVNYFISVFAEWWPKMAFLKPVTIFYYVNGPKIFNNPGWPWDDIAVLLSILAISSIAGAIIWNRRDLPL